MLAKNGATYSWPEWKGVKLTFFAPCIGVGICIVAGFKGGKHHTLSRHIIYLNINIKN